MIQLQLNLQYCISSVSFMTLQMCSLNLFVCLFLTIFSNRKGCIIMSTWSAVSSISYSFSQFQYNVSLRHPLVKDIKTKTYSRKAWVDPFFLLLCLL